MTIVLVGGGWGTPSVYIPFLAAAGPLPSVACLVVDEGDGAEYAARFAEALAEAGPCRPQPVLVPLGSPASTGFLAGFDALLVCGGLTPAYATALAPVAEEVRAFVAAGRPYAGFSAGAAVAATAAVVGGYRWAERPVCPADAAEDLDEVTVVAGLGLVPFAVDVHAAQWGTLGRLCAAVAGGLVAGGVAVDEDTAVVLDGPGVAAGGESAAGDRAANDSDVAAGRPLADPPHVADGWSARVIGTGAAHVVRPAGDGVSVRTFAAGDLPLDASDLVQTRR